MTKYEAGGVQTRQLEAEGGGQGRQAAVFGKSEGSDIWLREKKITKNSFQDRRDDWTGCVCLSY